MRVTYSGPLHGEPLAVELHNTLYLVRGSLHDGIADQAGAGAWLRSLASELPVDARAARVSVRDLQDLREHVRELLESAALGEPAPAAAVRALNALTAAAPRALVGELDGEGAVRIDEIRPGATPAATVLAALAESALELADATQAPKLQYCGAPGCALLFLRDHPRREWCSSACGNRARQARLVARRRSAEQAAARDRV